MVAGSRLANKKAPVGYVKAVGYRRSQWVDSTCKPLVKRVVVLAHLFLLAQDALLVAVWAKSANEKQCKFMCHPGWTITLGFVLLEKAMLH
jgi:hypothetical protein